jgi:hypothetical protein
MTVGSGAGVLEASGHQLRTTMVEACEAAATMTLAWRSEATILPHVEFLLRFT